MAVEKNLRIVAYSPDSYGLGHVRRSISIAGAVLAKVRDSSVLLLTGAPRAHYFDYPERCDYVKIPSITKDAGGHYVCRDLDLSLSEALKMRSRLIRMSVEGYDADVLLVDHSPLGLGGEILPTLKAVGRRTVRILGMRDVIDDPERVRAAWAKNGTIDVLREHYDHILVYGQRGFFDVISAYGIPADVARKTTFVGYVPRNGRRRDPEALRARFAPRTGCLVVVTVGGGGDGNLALRSFLDGFESLDAEPINEVLAWLHELRLPKGLPTHGADEEMALLDKRIAAFHQILREPPQEVDRIASRVLNRLANSSGSRPVLCHRDLHDKQILLDPNGGGTLIDLDLVAAGPAALDVGNILGHLRLRALKGARIRWDEIARRIAGSAIASRDIAESLPCWTASTLLRLALIYSRRRRSRGLLEELLHSADEALDGRGQWAGILVS